MTRLSSLWTLGVIALLLVAGSCRAEDDGETVPKVDQDLGAEREGSRTDDGAVQREEEAIKIDGLNVAQIKELRAKAEKHHFQAEVNRMMKLIINSLYKNKEIFLRELISNASDALDKLRLLSLTDKSALEVLEQFAIRIRADKENHKLDITDTGIGMTKEDLIKNLGTIAKSGTSDFLNKMQEASDTKELNDLIGQFGVGFYSSFLVADNVVVTSKAYGDGQYIWESDASKFSVVEDPRGDTLKRGTQVSLQMKPEAMNYLEEKTLKDLIIKYSQFINFPIYLWTEKTIEEEVPVEEDEAEKKEEKKDDDIIDDEDAKVEEAKDEDKPKTKKVTKTVYDWELINNSKPIWTRKPGEVEDKEYNDFYKTLTKDATEPLAKTHFIAEGEVTFKALLYVPKVQPGESFNRYGTRTDNIKLYVRRVFITDDFHEMMPNYLSFIRGVVDSDDLPLNVSRETLQQNKLIKIIRKKLIRKVLDMLKKLEPDEYEKFWKEYSTNIKLGVIEDTANKSRLAKLLRFFSSNGSQTSLAEYVSRMKDKQEAIYYIAGASKDEVEKSPFVERLLKKGYEVLYLVEAVDEYTIGALPEFEGKKFQNVAKEGLSLSDSKKSKEKLEETKKMFEPLTKWLSENALKDQITRAEISERLSNSPCALVAGMFAWTGNMERMALSNPHQKADDIQKTYYLNQKKTLEVNPRHPLIKELLRRVKDDAADDKAKEIALMMFRTATLRSGYMLKDTVEFADTVEQMMRQTLGVPADEEVEEDDTLDEEEEPQDQEDKDADDEDKDETEADSTTTGSDDHDEL